MGCAPKGCKSDVNSLPAITRSPPTFGIVPASIGDASAQSKLDHDRSTDAPPFVIRQGIVSFAANP